MFARPWRAPFPAGDAFRTRRRLRVLPSTWKSAAGFSGKCERPGGWGGDGLARWPAPVSVCRVKCCACRLQLSERAVGVSSVAGHCAFLSRFCQKTPQGGLIAGMLRGRNGKFGVGDICDLRFCGRSAGSLVVGGRKRGPLAAFSDNSERFLCSEAPSWRFLTVVASLLSAFSVLPSAGRQRCAFWMPCSRAPRFRASRSGPGIALSGIAFWSAALLGVSLSDDIALSGVSLSIGCLAPDRHRVLD